MQYTPVIPPFPGPPGGGNGTSPRRPPVIPSFSPNNPPATPSWAQPHQFPTMSPYMTGGAFVAGPPGSYFIPPVALPSGQVPSTPVAPVGSGGFSADWTGFPSNGSPYTQPGSHPQTPYTQTAQTHPQTPYTQAAQTPYTQAAQTPYTQAAQTPYTQAPQNLYTPAAAPPGTAYSTFQQPLPAGMPPPGMVPGAWQTPYAQPGGGALPPQGVPPAAAQPGPTRPPFIRPQDVSELDKVAKFAEGLHYGSVLEPFIAKKPPPEDGEREYLKWSMLFTTTQCTRSSDPHYRSWSDGRHAPATWPRVTSLRLVSRALPWAVDVAASNAAAGVTCGDVIEAIHAYMYTKISQAQYDGADAAQKRVLSGAYWYNRSTNTGVPGGKLPQTLLRLDWLGEYAMFGGIEADERAVRELCGVVLPCTFVLRVAKRHPMMEEEERDIAAREAAADERVRRRGRSRATSGNRSRGTSRGTSRAPDEEESSD
ncbi:hypothetical protein B0H21DRAFT_735528 [Amylocystis lapponica]|nr:hypothetical protein B0H21DRAFT_735528 [Amylocystis lapponica]